MRILSLGLPILIVLVFSACNQEKTIINHQNEKSDSNLILETLFFYSLSELQDKFGRQNMTTKFNEACSSCGPEGSPTYETSYSTILFPNSTKEVHIEWDSQQTKVKEVSVTLQGKEWKTKEGFRLGDSISKINQYFNNKSVSLVYGNWWYYNVNENYTLMFNSDELDYDNLSEDSKSTDSSLKNLVLVGISIRYNISEN